MIQFFEGAGFPTTRRELARRAPNLNDPNGYYRDIDLPPYASEDEIKRRCKRLLKKYHPDGWKPNRDKFERVQQIWATLGNPVLKAYYDNTPDGFNYLDYDVLKEAMDGSDSPGEVRDAMSKTSEPFWSYFAEGEYAEDQLLAQQWYAVLTRVASELGHDTRLVLTIADSIGYSFDGEGVSVPRVDPSTHQAVFLLSEPRAGQRCVTLSAGPITRSLNAANGV